MLEHPVEPRSNPNRARDHLANERTHLAWLRTAVAMMGFGVLIVRLRFEKGSLPSSAPIHTAQLGLLFAVVGLAMVPFALFRYFAGWRSIERDEFQPQTWSVVAFGVAIIVIGIAIVFYLLQTSEIVLPDAAKPRSSSR